MQRISPASLRLGANDVCYEPAPAVSRSAWLVEVTVRGPDGMPRRAVIGDTERKRLRLEILEPGEYAGSRRDRPRHLAANDRVRGARRGGLVRRGASRGGTRSR